MRDDLRDRAQAEALRIAHTRLEKLGWRYDTEDVGKEAAKILKALDKEMASNE